MTLDHFLEVDNKGQFGVFKIAYWGFKESLGLNTWITVGYLYAYEYDYKRFMNRFPKNCSAFWSREPRFCNLCKENKKEIHILGWVNRDKKEEVIEKFKLLTIISVLGLIKVCKKCFSTGLIYEHNESYQYELGVD